MPIRKVKGGYQWGRQGKVYPNRKGAERQAAAAYASGYKESENEDAGRCPHCGFTADPDRGEFYDPTYPCPHCNKGGARLSAGYGRLRGDEPGLTSPDFKSGDTLPKEYTADGKNISPPLQWGVPEETAELVVIIDDPDSESASSRTPWVHWVAYGIPGSKTGLKAGAEVPKVGTNSWGENKYRGPEPPAGPPHRYWIKVYALDAPLSLEAGASKREVLQAMEGHVIDRDGLVVFYSRDKSEGAAYVKDLLQESLRMTRELLDVRGSYRLDEAVVDVKIVGWGGKRKIPIKQVRAFIADLRAASAMGAKPRLGGGSVGFSTFDQVVQLPKKDVPQLDAIVKKNKLRAEAPRKATRGITGLPNV